MNIHILIGLMLCVCCVGTCAASGEIVTDDSTIYIYGSVEKTIGMNNLAGQDINYNRTVCINATCIEGCIYISGGSDYDLEYYFIADINDTNYVTRIIRLKQEQTDKNFIGKTIGRTLYLDGMEIGYYETKCSFWTPPKKNTMYFNLIDKEIRFGDEIISDVSLAFTQLNYNDQKDFLTAYGVTQFTSPFKHKYITVGYLNENSDGVSMELTGLTGAFYNAFGAPILSSLPIVGGAIGSFGKTIQGLLYTPLFVIQFSFDVIFTFLFLIINNWWYSILLLEIICIIPAIQYKGYYKMVCRYFEMHILVFTFLWNMVVLKLIGLILRLIEIIRNLFRI